MTKLIDVNYLSEFVTETILTKKERKGNKFGPVNQTPPNVGPICII